MDGGSGSPWETLGGGIDIPFQGGSWNITYRNNGNQPTTRDRVGDVYGKLQEEYFTSAPTKKHDFTDEYGRYRKGPASVVPKTPVAGVKPPEFKQKVLHVVDMAGNWSNDPDVVLEVLRRTADKWGIQ